MSYLISIVFGIAVGIAYGLFDVRSPAPPLVALAGLLGIVIGEQGVAWLRRSPHSVPTITRTAAPPSTTSPDNPERR